MRLKISQHEPRRYSSGNFTKYADFYKLVRSYMATLACTSVVFPDLVYHDSYTKWKNANLSNDARRRRSRIRLLLHSAACLLWLPDRKLVGYYCVI